VQHKSAPLVVVLRPITCQQACCTVSDCCLSVVYQGCQTVSGLFWRSNQRHECHEDGGGSRQLGRIWIQSKCQNNFHELYTFLDIIFCKALLLA